MYSIGNRAQILKLQLRSVIRKCDLHRKDKRKTGEYFEIC